MAVDFGTRLLSEIEEVSLDEVSAVQVPVEGRILRTLRLQIASNDVSEPDSIQKHLLKQRDNTSPIIELTTPRPEAGVSTLLRHLATDALVDRHATAVIIDCDSTFSIPALAHYIRTALLHRSPTSPDRTAGLQDLEDELSRLLHHIHIFRPQSVASLLSTITSLPSYLLNTASTTHHSIDRNLSFIAIHNLSAFYWPERGESEEAAANSQPYVSAFARLSPALKNASKALGGSPVIVSSWGLGAPLQGARRMLVRRDEVRKFPVEISAEEALREEGDRRHAMDEAGLEVVEQGRDGARFALRVGENGILVESDHR